jgi:hypothetical protein
LWRVNKCGLETTTPDPLSAGTGVVCERDATQPPLNPEFWNK